MKNKFIKEVSKINNDAWRLACMALVDKLEDYFWHVAASSSGKYHPSCDLGDGGLVRHSIMVSNVAVDLIVAEIFIEDTKINRDKAIIASLFHDCLKHGIGETKSDHTVFEHPIYASDFIRENLKDVIDEDNLNDICRAINTHMGKWTTSKYSSVTLTPPVTAFEKLIHTADYIASRKYIGGLTEWNENN